MNKNKRNNLYTIIWAVLSFSSLFIFFFFLHPQIILDFDDWSCITTLRLPLPLFNYWNPSRVFSELFYPLCGFISGMLAKIFPSLGIIKAVSMVTGIFLSLIVFLYEFLFMKTLNKQFNLSLINAELLSCVFILLHFVFFRSNATDNFHFFRSTNITCCYYYLIPAIINCCMVLFLINYHDKQYSKPGKIIFYLALYLTIFSNQFASIIIVCYAFLVFAKNTIVAIKSKQIFKNYISLNTTYIIIGAMYVFSLLADGLGGRGRYSSSSDTTIDFALIDMPPVIYILKQVSIVIIILALISLILFFVLNNKNKISSTQKSLLLIFILSDILAFALTMLLCARVNPTYILRTEVLFGAGFYIIAEIVFIFSLAIPNSKYSPYVIAAAFAILFLYTNTSGKTFIDSYTENIGSDICYAISESLVKQVTDAVNNGETYAKIYVLESTTDPGSNWPQHFWLSEYLPKMLKLFWVIDKPITVEIVPDYNLNTFYGVTTW